MTSGWHWTEDEDAVLRTMWSAGEPAAAIAKRLGRTANAVCCRARYLTLALRSRDKRRRSTANRFRGYATRGMRHPNVPILEPHARAGTYDSRAAVERLWEAWCA